MSKFLCTTEKLMVREQLLQQIKNCLSAAYQERLRGVVLYGSEARGTQKNDSDIDLLVLLDGTVDYGHDMEKGIDAVYPLSLELGRRISAKPVSILEYDQVDCPLYHAAHMEGVVL